MDGLNTIIKEIFGDNRGMAIGCATLSVLSLIGMIAAVLTPKIGGYAPLVGIAVAAMLILIVFGVAKNNRIAKVIAGLVLVIAGVGMWIFIISDFLTSMKKGQSPMSKGMEGESYMTWVVILLATGLAMIGGGLMLLGVIKQ